MDNMNKFKTKLERILYLSELMVMCGTENVRALYVLQDELQELSEVYANVADSLDKLA